MPATATTLKYAPTVAVDLSANEINFADAELQGHRVQINMAAADLNPLCTWTRTSGSDRPAGEIDPTAFRDLLETTLSTTYTDLDAIASGLSFSTNSITNADNRSGNANDLVMAYVLYKVYGSSAYDTSDKVYNAKDALNMLANADIGAAVQSSITTHTGRGDSVDQMFRDLLAADPARFFDAQGKQEPGLFETNTDVNGFGNWKLTADDILELKLEFTFKEQVSRRVVSTQQQPLAGSAPVGEKVTEEVIIPANSKFAIRLQIKVTA